MGLAEAELPKKKVIHLRSMLTYHTCHWRNTLVCYSASKLLLYSGLGLGMPCFEWPVGGGGTLDIIDAVREEPILHFINL
jgi:hypothetical protein